MGAFASVRAELAERRILPFRRSPSIAAAAILGLLLLGGCTKHEELLVTPWLKIDIARPVTGSSGVIVLGSREETFSLKVGNRWIRLGKGHASTYMLLADEQAALVELHDGKGLQLVSADAAPRAVPASFGRRGDVSVLPGGEAIDVFECRVPAEPAGCREVQIDRYNLTGTLLATYSMVLPEAYSDCQLIKIAGYDSSRLPHVYAQCKMNSDQAKCVFAAPGKEGPSVYAVKTDEQWIACSASSPGGVSLTESPRFTVLQ